MSETSLCDALLAGAVTGAVILSLGLLFLWILRPSKLQFNLGFVMVLMGCFVCGLGLWAVLLRGLGPFPGPEPTIEQPADRPADPAAVPVETAPDRDSDKLDPLQLQPFQSRD